MTTLAQIVGVEAGLRDEAKVLTGTAKTMLGADKSALTGMTRTFEPLEGADLSQVDTSDQATRVQVKVEDVLERLGQGLVRLFDVTFTRDFTDQVATAKVVVTKGGKQHTLLDNVPATYLLFLDKQLTELRKIFQSIPVYDAATAWVPDPGDSGQYRTESYKTPGRTKVRHSFIKYEATKEHPAQVEVFTDDTVVGYWDTVKFTGAVSPDRYRQLLDRVDELKRAVIYALQEANATPATDRKAGSIIFEWLLAK